MVRDKGVLAYRILVIETLYSVQQAAVRVVGETLNWLEVQRGVRQSCILSLYRFHKREI